MRKLVVPRRWLLAVPAVALLVLSVSACGGSYEDPAAALEPLRQAADQYAGPFKGVSSVEVYRPGSGRPEGYIKGRVVLLEGKRLSVWHEDLPVRLRALNPDDVGTAVLVKEHDRKVGKYSSGEPAWQTVWRVTVVDLAKGKVVGRALLSGDYPPTVADIQAGENYGPPPWEDFVAYLKKLPRR